ncbi:MAG TPA: hydroxysqualene dehydroxylase HpnE [Stellaceae bacterium]|nr:hydroxysqualene dehydroxylase HpnE [Stellaceae bacterium]
MSGPGRVHVVGAGLAGLAASVALADKGWRVVLYESALHAGGRCRSYYDPELGTRIDNGNHLLLSGNRSALTHLRLIDALGTFEAPSEAAFPFVDVASGERWILRPNEGTLPWWVLLSGRRVAGTRARDYLAVRRLRGAGAGETVAQCLNPNSLLYRRLWQPVAVAALNTAAEVGSARLFWQVLSETLGRGGGACHPLLPREGLSESLVDPALAMLRAKGGDIRFGARLRAFHFIRRRVAELNFDSGLVDVGADWVILAVPATAAARLVPELIVPDDQAPIVNAHYRAAAPAGTPPFIGIVGGTAEWVFKKRDVISVTVSAADRLVDQPADTLSGLLWRDVAAALRLPAQPGPPPSRIVKERRATFRATPEQLTKRPATQTRWNNLLLAGDYVDIGLPATIEGAIRSGLAAAEAIARHPEAGAS